MLFDAMEDSKKWQIKEGALKLLAALAKTAPAQVSVCLPAIVPLISERMVDPREQVRRGLRGEAQPARAGHPHPHPRSCVAAASAAAAVEQELLGCRPFGCLVAVRWC